MDYFTALRAFVRSVDLGSFSKAAAEQDAKVSTISRHVSALEADVGAALLNRSTRRIHLTEAGSALYARAVTILADLDDARASTKDLNSRPQGLLRVTAPSAYGRRHLMPHLPRFLTRYPDIRVDLLLDDRILDLIEAGLDVAVRIGVLGDSSLVAKRLGPHYHILVASPAYLADHDPVDEPDDLLRLECLAFSLQQRTAWYCWPAAQGDGEPRAVPVGGRLRINDTDALFQAASDGLGVALLPRWAVSGALREGRLIAVLPQWRWSMTVGPQPAIWGVYPPKKLVSPKVRAFLDFATVIVADGKDDGKVIRTSAE